MLVVCVLSRSIQVSWRLHARTPSLAASRRAGIVDRGSCMRPRTSPIAHLLRPWCVAARVDRRRRRRPFASVSGSLGLFILRACGYGMGLYGFCLALFGVCVCALVSYDAAPHLDATDTIRRLAGYSPTCRGSFDHKCSSTTDNPIYICVCV